MNKCLLLGIKRWMFRIPRPIWQQEVVRSARASEKSLAFMTVDHHRLVLLEGTQPDPGHDRPLVFGCVGFWCLYPGIALAQLSLKFWKVTAEEITSMIFIENGEGSLSAFGLFLLIGFLVFFVGLIVLAIQYDRKQRQKIQQVAQSLGFVSITPSEELTQKISWLYLRAGSITRYVLRYVSRRVIPDGEMVLFDLVDTSGEDESITEQQAVAIVSPYMNLPQFSIFPKAESKYMLSGFANRIVEWGLARMGTPVPFSDSPEFAERYVVSSLQPEEVRRFFNDDLVYFFSQTQLYTLHAGGDVFTFSEMNTKFKTGDLEDMTLRVNRALEIFRQFHK